MQRLIARKCIRRARARDSDSVRKWKKMREYERKRNQIKSKVKPHTEHFPFFFNVSFLLISLCGFSTKSILTLQLLEQRIGTHFFLSLSKELCNHHKLKNTFRKSCSKFCQSFKIPLECNRSNS